MFTNNLKLTEKEQIKAFCTGFSFIKEAAIKQLSNQSALKFKAEVEEFVAALNRVLNAVNEKDSFDNRPRVFIEFTSFLNLVEKFLSKYPELFSGERSAQFLGAKNYLSNILETDPSLNADCCSLMQLSQGMPWYKLAARPVRNAILPALMLRDSHNEENKLAVHDVVMENQSQNKSYKTAIRRTRIPVKCGEDNPSLIDSISVTYPSSADTQNGSQDVLHLVYFLGNGECYETKIEEMMIYARELQILVKKPVQITAFNYPGVLDSEGDPACLQHLVMAGQGVVEDIIDKGADPETIILYGHSLGGIISTFTAKNLHQSGKPVNLMNGRSLVETTKFAGFTNTLFGETFMTNWRGDAVSAFNQIPSEYKDYFLVKNPKKKPDSMADFVIRHDASIYRGIKAKETDPVQMKNPAKGFEPGLSLAEKKKLRRKRKLRASEDYKKKVELFMETKSVDVSLQDLSNLHNVGLHCIVDEDGQSAQDKLFSFCAARFEAACAKKSARSNNNNSNS